MQYTKDTEKQLQYDVAYLRMAKEWSKHLIVSASK